MGQPRRRDVRVLTPRDERLLAWIGEQYGVPSDVLAWLLGRSRSGQLGPAHSKRNVQRVYGRWRDAGWAGAEQIQHGLVWVWPRQTIETRFRPWSPTGSVAQLGHVRDTALTRLWLEHRFPNGEWVSERYLRQEAASGFAGDRRHVPDAEFRLPGGVKVAVEVERTLKGRRRIEEVLDDLRGYDGVWYLADPTVLPSLTAAAERLPSDWLQVQPIPTLATLAGCAAGFTEEDRHG